MSRYARRRDSNHAAIRKELRQAKCEVWDTGSHGDDWPDLFVRRRECTLWVEVKTEKGKPTPGQVEMLRVLNGIVARRAEDVLEELDRREFGP